MNISNKDIDKKPMVSIGMPVFNGEKYIREAIDSLLAQTFTDFELIISDNASSDTTQSICEEYLRKDSRIRYIRQDENRGPLANFLFVHSEAVGKYFMWAAHDDRWQEDYIDKLVVILEKEPECSLAFSYYIVRNLESGYEELIKTVGADTSSSFKNYFSTIRHMCPSMIYGIYRKDCMDMRQLDRPFDFADVHFVSELASRTKIKVVKEYLYIAGTKGERIPYSITHKRINRSVFLNKQMRLVFSRFSLHIAIYLFFILCIIMLRNKIHLWNR